jgi:hypothetical protein
MPFVKLDTGILNSTLWIERECREIFITALLMAYPKEFEQPIPTLKVRNLDNGDFVVPAGWYGFIEAAGVGIVRRAMVEQDAGMIALEKLSMPDPESRSPEFGGRRMVRVDGGYIVLNYMKYRDRDYTAAERQRKLRERKKNAMSHRDVDMSHRDITQTDADSRVQIADADKNKTQESACFSNFWDKYPIKECQIKARHCWIKGNYDSKFGEVMASLTDWSKSERWRDKQYIPHAWRWLSEGRWKENPYNREKGPSLEEQRIALEKKLGIGR